MYDLHSTLYTIQSTINDIHSTLYNLQSMIYTLHSTIYNLHYTMLTDNWDFSSLWRPKYSTFSPTFMFYYFKMSKSTDVHWSPSVKWNKFDTVWRHFGMGNTQKNEDWKAWETHIVWRYLYIWVNLRSDLKYKEVPHCKRYWVTKHWHFLTIEIWDPGLGSGLNLTFWLWSSNGII